MKNISFFISTGTPIEEIKYILKERGIFNYFTEVYGSPERKDKHLEKIISGYGFNPDELLFYGDANTDLNAAKNAGIFFVLVKNKFNIKLTKEFKGKSIFNFENLI